MSGSDRVPMLLSGFCMWPGTDDRGHLFCTRKDCACPHHTEQENEQ